MEEEAIALSYEGGRDELERFSTLS